MSDSSKIIPPSTAFDGSEDEWYEYILTTFGIHEVDFIEISAEDEPKGEIVVAFCQKVYGQSYIGAWRPKLGSWVLRP